MTKSNRFFSFYLTLGLSALSPIVAYSQTGSTQTSPNAYRQTQASESEFDNYNDGFVSYWQYADEDYQDTVFGEQLYSEPSTATKLELLRLLSKETPSSVVFLHAISMGLSVDEMLLASLEYQPEKARNLASSAVSVLPYLDNRNPHHRVTYDLDELTQYINGLLEKRNQGFVDPGSENIPYLVKEVVNKYFNDSKELVPYPDWLDGQFHFMASAKELLDLSENTNAYWYKSNVSQDHKDRPIFVSLYEHNKTVLIDGLERINNKFNVNPNYQFPVVFVYNGERERSASNLGYPLTIDGIQDAYSEKGLMLTPTPEWQTGEYHALVNIDEFYRKFEIPQESDFEPEAWQKLLSDARDYDVNDTSILVVIVEGDNLKEDELSKQEKIQSLFRDSSLNNFELSNSMLAPGSMLAAWDDPRTESQFKYTSKKNSNDDGNADDLSFESILGKGVILNRPDLIAALKAIGVTGVPVSFYYVDKDRVKPYFRGPRSLIQAALGASAPSIVLPSGGVSSPQLPPASPPGLP